MIEVDEARYLGDWLSCDGLSESVATTVNKRLGLAKLATYEVRAILEDCRINIAGGLQTGILIWESAILPKLLYNSECWFNTSKQTLNN